MPNIFIRRRVYKTIHSFLLSRGFNRVSVWGFKKGAVPRYSSVTRDFYVGFGAGAASNFPNMFYFNTFNVSEYIKTLLNNKLPISIEMNISKTLSKYYWFYWKLYDTYFSRHEINKVFGKDKKISLIINIFKTLKLLGERNSKFALTERGSFWIHLAQNYFMLNYIDKVWTICMKEPWPERIEI
ncbi:hypothetical protein JW766_00765 [Candidatus Dojkabacteria bacterium]|nr:hypothetical protein [Candidatus Dojkabacteria bacterium]